MICESHLYSETCQGKDAVHPLEAVFSSYPLQCHGADTAWLFESEKQPFPVKPPAPPWEKGEGGGIPGKTCQHRRRRRRLTDKEVWNLGFFMYFCMLPMGSLCISLSMVWNSGSLMSGLVRLSIASLPMKSGPNRPPTPPLLLVLALLAIASSKAFLLPSFEGSNCTPANARLIKCKHHVKLMGWPNRNTSTNPVKVTDWLDFYTSCTRILPDSLPQHFP